MRISSQPDALLWTYMEKACVVAYTQSVFQRMLSSVYYFHFFGKQAPCRILIRFKTPPFPREKLLEFRGRLSAAAAASLGQKEGKRAIWRNCGMRTKQRNWCERSWGKIFSPFPLSPFSLPWSVCRGDFYQKKRKFRLEMSLRGKLNDDSPLPWFDERKTLAKYCGFFLIRAWAYAQLSVLSALQDSQPDNAACVQSSKRTQRDKGMGMPLGYPTMPQNSCPPQLCHAPNSAAPATQPGL